MTTENIRDGSRIQIILIIQIAQIRGNLKAIQENNYFMLKGYKRVTPACRQGIDGGS
jgi:hypothetical protein